MSLATISLNHGAQLPLPAVELRPNLGPTFFNNVQNNALTSLAERRGEIFNALAACQDHHLQEFFQALEEGLDVRELEELSGISVQELKDFYQVDRRPQVVKTWKSEALKAARVIFRFFPKFLDTCIDVLHLTQGNGPTTIWDYHAALMIYAKVFSIPHAIFTIVSIWIQIPTVCVVITTGVVLGLVILLYLYLKFRPCPTSLEPFENLNERGAPSLIRQAKVRHLESLMNGENHINVMVIGKPGIGKSEFVKSLRLENKQVFYVDATQFTSQEFGNIQEELRKRFQKIEGFEQNVVFIFDELHKAGERNPRIFDAIKNFSERFRMIAVVTEEITEEAFSDRFAEKIYLEEPSDAQTEEILNDLILDSSVRIAPGIAQAIIQRTNAFPGLNPRKAVQCFNKSINKLQAYVSKDLFDKKEQLDQLVKDNRQRNVLGHREEIATLRQEIHDLETTLRREGAVLLQMKPLIQQEIALKRNISYASDKKLLIQHAWYLPELSRRIDTLGQGLQNRPYQLTADNLVPPSALAEIPEA